MKTTLGVLVLVALLAGGIGWAHADGPVATTHHGKGRVVAIAPGKITLAEPHGLHPMTIDATTKTVIPSEARVSRIGLGD